MRFNYDDESSTIHYAAKLIERDTGLYWTTRQGDISMIVCCPFGKYPFNDLCGFCDTLNESGTVGRQFSSIEFNNDTYYVRIVDYKEKEKNRGVKFLKRACSYIILACELDGDTIHIYKPKNIRDQSKDISLQIELTYREEVVSKKSFLGNSKEIPTGYIILDTDKLDYQDYDEGDICYVIDDLQIPLTKSMFNFPIYIKTNKEPVFVSKKPGLLLTVTRADN